MKRLIRPLLALSFAGHVAAAAGARGPPGGAPPPGGLTAPGPTTPCPGAQHHR